MVVVSYLKLRVSGNCSQCGEVSGYGYAKLYAAINIIEGIDIVLIISLAFFKCHSLPITCPWLWWRGQKNPPGYCVSRVRVSVGACAEDEPLAYCFFSHDLSPHQR